MPIIEIILVGKTPLGSAVRAGIVGCLATTLGSMFFLGTMYPLIFGIAVVLILLPIVYLISKRDNPEPVETAVEASPAGSVPTTGQGQDAAAIEGSRSESPPRPDN